MIFSPKKSLGQHFLRCEWVIPALIHSAELTKEDSVLEIGPGKGVLTRALASRVKKVVAIEKDHNLVTYNLKRVAQEHKNIEIIEGDILKLLPDILIRYMPHTPHYKVVANIPYYITSRLLRIILENNTKPAVIVLTVQKEVAQRIVAKPPRTNLLALSIQSYGTPEIIKDIPAVCFSPKPKVDSAIIKISRISDRFFVGNKIDQKLFFNVIKRAFSQKRKLLSNSLSPFMPKKEINTLFASLGFSPNARPEEMSLTQWVSIVKAVERY